MATPEWPNTSRTFEGTSVMDVVMVVEVNDTGQNVSVESPGHQAALGCGWTLRGVWLLGFASLLGVLLPAGLLLNLLTILLFVWRRLHRSATNLLLLNLAAADLLNTAAVFPLHLAAALSGRWVGGRPGCVLYAQAFHLLGAVSVNTVAAISVERYYSVTRSQTGIQLMQRHVYHVILVTWLLAVAGTIPPLLGWSSYILDESSILCSHAWSPRDALHISYTVYYFCLCLLLPLAVEAVCYYRVYVKVHHVSIKVQKSRSSLSLIHQRPSQLSVSSNQSQRASVVSNNSCFGQRTSPPQNSRPQSQGRLARMMTVMVGVSVVCWYPHGLCIVLQVATETQPCAAYLLTSLIAKASVVANPLIYVALNKKFRQDFMRLLQCQCMRWARRVEATDGGGDTPKGVSQADTKENLVAPCRNGLSPRTGRYTHPVLSTIKEVASFTGSLDRISPFRPSSRGSSNTKAYTISHGKIKLPDGVAWLPAFNKGKASRDKRLERHRHRKTRKTAVVHPMTSSVQFEVLTRQHVNIKVTHTPREGQRPGTRCSWHPHNSAGQDPRIAFSHPSKQSELWSEYIKDDESLSSFQEDFTDASGMDVDSVSSIK